MLYENFQSICKSRRNFPEFKDDISTQMLLSGNQEDKCLPLSVTNAHILELNSLRLAHDETWQTFLKWTQKRYPLPNEAPTASALRYAVIKLSDL